MDEAESGVDKEELLREIAGAIPMEEPLPEPLPAESPAPEVPPEPLPEPLSEPLVEPLAEFPPEPTPEAPPAPASSRSLPRPTWWTVHRHEVAGLVTAFVALVWMSLGIAARAWAPSLIGVTFALGALLIGTRAVWAAD